MMMGYSMMQAAQKIDSLLDGVLSRLKQQDAAKILTDFTRLLYEYGVAKDLEVYPASELDYLARQSFALFNQRRPGRHKLRVYNPQTGHPDTLGKLTVIEIANDDMPFLVDSTLSLLSERGLRITLVLHPTFFVKRSAKGEITRVFDDESTPSEDEVVRESFVHIHVSRLVAEEDREALERELDAMLKDVHTVVLDWPIMKDRLGLAVAQYQTGSPPVAVEELSESIQFLQWLLDNHFTFLGMREHAFTDKDKSSLEVVEGSGLGLLRDPGFQVLRRGSELVEITPEVQQFLSGPTPLIITKANVRSTVHRRSHMDYIGIQQFADDGTLSGELMLIGLFTASAYTRPPRHIPMLRHKVSKVLAHSGFKLDSHSGKALTNVLETFPRDELFQIDVETLSEFALAILQLEERPRPRVFVRRHKFDCFVSALVYVPRDNYNTKVRRRLGELLARSYDGRVSAFYPAFLESTMVRVHYIIGRYGGPTPEPDIAALEEAASEITRGWDDRLVEEIEAGCPGEAVQGHITAYRGAFSAAYQEAFTPRQAVEDLWHMEQLRSAGDIAVRVHRAEEEPDHVVRLKLLHLGQPIALSDRLPILENMGFCAINECTYFITRSNPDGSVDPVVLHEIELRSSDAGAIDAEVTGRLVNEGFTAVWSRMAENDGYNALILRENLSWRQVAVLRACSKYLRQSPVPYSSLYMAATLDKYCQVARMLLELFETRFDPDFAGEKAKEKRSDAVQAILNRIDAILATVPSLDEDRIIRHFSALIMAMTRTNYYQRDDDGALRPTIAFKIKSRALNSLPDPKPFAEIFVCSPDVEGVHLRGGKIARGGIRWSDRPEDFRTEILGLAKAQNVKNAVIVPVGAKGGFVAKRLVRDGSREDIIAKGVRCYKLFIASLLDLTDNLDGNRAVAPKKTLRYDGDDPYLVVAADKGTASFSDIANDISGDYGFWLDDAFASGGSAGYDHKKMGITARGAWEAVKRHFREMDVDIQTTPFTALGVGDMSGDVFGNGMLLSKAIKLVGAFDHRDIFIDPDPDPERGWRERKRLFALSRSSWQDYATDAISKGGGVFSRQAKSIPLTPQIRRLTGLAGRHATPNEIIAALLRARIDLIWFGGIGTYIRADDETDSEVGDRSNDAVRITAGQVGAKVIGEGANLAMTQRARVAFAMEGGRVNTDAVDNSAGVNSSDLEVNIKIALRGAEVSGSLARSARNELLVAMSDEVGELVLRNNSLQTLCLTLCEMRAAQELASHNRLIRLLERKGLLNRGLEFLPDTSQIKARMSRGKGLTRPELAVLMAYAKIMMFDQLVASRVPDDPYLSRELRRYFPDRLNKHYADRIESHRLRREIIATMLSNSIVNRTGPSFFLRLEEETGASIEEIAAAYALARDSFGFSELNDLVDALDNRVASSVQLELYLELQSLLCEQTVWFLHNAPLKSGLEDVVRHYAAGLGKLGEAVPDILGEKGKANWHQRIAKLKSAGIEEELARRFCTVGPLAHGLDIISVAGQSQRSLKAVARGFFALGERLRIDRLVAAADKMKATDYYDRVAIKRTLAAIAATHRSLVTRMIMASGARKDALAAWSKTHGAAIGKTRAGVAEALQGGPMTLARLAVASSRLHDLCAALEK